MINRNEESDKLAEKILTMLEETKANRIAKIRLLSKLIYALIKFKGD